MTLLVHYPPNDEDRGGNSSWPWILVAALLYVVLCSLWLLEWSG